MSLVCLHVDGRVRMIPSEFETSLPRLLGHCRVRDVAVVFVCLWSSSHDPFRVRDVAAEFL